MKKKIVSIILSVSMVVAFIPSFAFAVGGVENPQETPDPGSVSEVVTVPDAETVEVTEPAPEPEAPPVVNKENRIINADPTTTTKDSSYNIGDYKFALSETTYFYDGNPHLPEVICAELTKDKDYKVEGNASTDPGTYHISITGIEPYTGSIELEYTIVETSISLNETSVSLYRNGTFGLKATVSNPNGDTTYSSSDTAVASVSASGVITAKAKGSATITVKNGFANKTVNVTVKNPNLNMTKATIYLNTSKTLKITGKIGKATFKSSNKKVASVNVAGKITAKKKGTCTITVKTNGITLKCKVTVKNPSLSKSKLAVYNTDKYKLKVLGGKGKITWKSSNKTVATVTSKGVVRGKKGGACTITAKRGQYTMKCKIKVPKHYKGYSKIPDFGALYGKTAAKRDYSESNAIAYKADKSYLNKYINVLKKKGFKYYQSSEGVKIYVNSAYDVVGVIHKKGLMVVVYQNAKD
ncbi:MAG: Ig-like domain-containing protein [Firmicutes bacterium]|nr:Ig-like domain-containing protein [Bacillota bacterium]